jgi:branched-chain amino acid transport system ATP-binding protein
MSAPGDSALEVSDLEVAYGGILAVKNVSLRVSRGEIVTLIGANGAGKTTTLKSRIPRCCARSRGSRHFRQHVRA